MVKSHAVRLLALFSATLTWSLAPALAETVLLDFSSATCGPCQQMRPVVQQIATAGFHVRDVNIHREPQVAARFGVTQLPTFIVMVDGQEAERTVGLTSFAQLQQMLSRGSSHASPPVRPLSPTAGSPDKHRALVEATVKITVEDAEGKSTGTGTIVDARSGEALILTCGHLFRSSAGKGPITVTLFQMSPQGAQPGPSYSGRLVVYDLERDLGLLSIRPNVSVQAAKIASSSMLVPPGTLVASVGCNGGQNATVSESHVTANDRYQGPGNIEVAGAPVEGRSGGGLFNPAGELIGVCFAADTQQNEGLYASLGSIHAKLNDLGLSTIFESPAANALVTPPQPTALPQFAAETGPSFAVRGQEPVPLPPEPAGDAQGLAARLNPVEQAAWDEIQRRGADSEIICIIRPHSPDGKSEVITLNNASPDFVRELTQPTTTAAAAQLLR